jgi:hypothetical protein
MEFVIALFILYPKHDQNKTGHSHCQPRNIDKRKQLMPLNIAQTEFYVIDKHWQPPYISNINLDVGKNEKDYKK